MNAMFSLERLYDNFVRLINNLTPEEMEQETERAIWESRDSYLMEDEDERSDQQKDVV